MYIHTYRGHLFSDDPLVRQPVGPTTFGLTDQLSPIACWSDNITVRPTAHWSNGPLFRLHIGPMTTAKSLSSSPLYCNFIYN